MSAKALLGQLQVQSPCTASWDSMTGNDKIRFCKHCHLSVNNLSSMSRKEIRRLVRKSDGRLCVRYQRRPNGLFASKYERGLHQIQRRVSRLASGLFTAAITVTPAATTWTVPVTAAEPIVASGEPQDVLNTAVVVGTVEDANGAVITSASVSLSNGPTGLTLYTSVNLSGEFRFEALSAGFYHLRVVAPGFAASEQSFYVNENREIRLDRTLEVEAIEETVEVESNETAFPVTSGAVAFVPPLDPFIRAAQDDDLSEVTRLIAGRDVNLRDQRSNTTALEHAVINANREMVQLLLAAGAKVDTQNEAGETVLMMLDTDATTDLVWDLINAGAKVNSRDKEGNTPLIEAADASNVDLLKTLLEAGAQVNAKNKQGQTALMMAAAEGMVNSVRLLLLAGAEIDAVDKLGKNSLWYATDSNHKAVIRLLRSQGGTEIVTKTQALDK